MTVHSENRHNYYSTARHGPLGALEIAFEQLNPHSRAYKELIKLLEVSVASEVVEQILLRHAVEMNIAEEKASEIKHEKEKLKEEEHEKRDAAIAHNEEIAEQKQQEARTAKELHREISERVKFIKELDYSLYKYEKQKSDIDLKISVKSKEIAGLEKGWSDALEKTADKFVSDNFTLNENGKYTSDKNPAVELLDGGVDVIKKVFTDAKSPAELQKHNPQIIDNPERMMQVDDVRKEVNLARKIDKIVHKDVREELGKNRKIIVKRVVLDDAGNPVFETDASGKKRVKTERVELDPQTEKLKDSLATDESTKKKKAHLVCLGDVCFLKRDLLSAPISHTPDQTVLATKLLVSCHEKNQLEEESQSLAEKITNTKAAIAEAKAEVDSIDTEITKLHPEQTELKAAAPLKAGPEYHQMVVDVQKEVKEDVEEEQPQSPRLGRS